MQIVEDNNIILIKLMHNAAAYALLYKKLRDKVDKSNSITKLAATLKYILLTLV
jgi:hypothetical protein